MSVYIKGMEMPKSGAYEVSIDSTNEKDKTLISLFVRGEGGFTCCGVYEAVPVPSHGDLIDRTSLLMDIIHSCVFSGKNGARAEIAGAQKVMNRISAAPIVVPADGGADND